MSSLNTALAWCLLHSLWIALGTWVLINLASTFLSKAKNRRLLKISSLLLFFGFVVSTLFSGLTGTASVDRFLYMDTESFGLQSSFSWFDQLNFWVGQNSPVINSIWVVGIIIGLTRYLYNRKALVKTESSAIHCSDDKAQLYLNRIRKALNITRRVSIKVSALVESPMTVGFVKPIIYFPIGLISGFSSDELETILRHELAHIKRHDYLVNLFLVMLETLFFFNPIVLLLVRDLRREMEYVCDDEVIQAHDQFAYARALLKLQENSISYQVALAAQNNNSEFKNRVERMINPNKPKAGSRVGLVVILLATLLVSSAFVGNTPPESSEEITMISETPQALKQDTLRVKSRADLEGKLKEFGFEYLKNKVVILDGERVRFIKGKNKALEKADKMMKEIEQELVKDGILNENKQKITLMFQYSDVLNGKASLGDKYEKYKGILNRYFPVYDSFATTRVFRYARP
ncbi:MAG: hypothetical protein Roseis2KO_56080 [Roseivirga sp.]